MASAGSLSQTLDGMKVLADGGVAAIVMFSLFEEQIRRDADDHRVRNYLTMLERASAALDIPVLASLNGADIGGWTSLSRELHDAGAAALELNTYVVPGNVRTSGTMVIDRHLEIVAAVTESVDIPVAVKLSPYFSSVGSMALRLVEAGADGLVLFNRFLQPDVDIETLEATTTWPLSSPDEGRLSRTWIAALRPHTTASLAAATGVADGTDVVKNLLVGADVVMSTSALIRRGPGYARTMLDELESYLIRKSFGSLDALRGALAVPAEDGNTQQRTSYVTAMEAAMATYGRLG